MNILVTGGKGQLGLCLKDVVNNHNTNNNYIFTDVDELNITDFEKVKEYIVNNGVNMVINCAAYTDVKSAEDNPVMTTLINTNAVGNLAEIMKKVNGVLIHISTDYVFGSEHNTPIREDYNTCALNTYGFTKLLGESFIKRSKCNYLIFRTSWLYSEYGNNFVKTMCKLTDEKDELNVVFDQVGTPTYAHDLALALFDIIESEKYVGSFGTYHFSNEGICSWYDFAVLIKELCGHTCNIIPCDSYCFPNDVQRPPYSVLDKTLFKKTFKRNIPYWTDSVKKCINNLKKS